MTAEIEPDDGDQDAEPEELGARPRYELGDAHDQPIPSGTRWWLIVQGMIVAFVIALFGLAIFVIMADDDLRGPVLIALLSSATGLLTLALGDWLPRRRPPRDRH